MGMARARVASLLADALAEADRCDRRMAGAAEALATATADRDEAHALAEEYRAIVDLLDASPQVSSAGNQGVTIRVKGGDANPFLRLDPAVRHIVNAPANWEGWERGWCGASIAPDVICDRVAGHPLDNERNEFHVATPRDHFEAIRFDAHGRRATWST